MSRISEKQLEALAAEMRRQVAVYAPEWTEFDESDPGVTLVQLFAFLTETLLYRTNPPNERRAAAALHLTLAAQALAAISSSTQSHPLRRVSYFEGQVLTAGDLRDEQTYVRARLSRRNRTLHGDGIVAGLEVSIARFSGPEGDQLIVEPGLAFDGRGDEIEIAERQTLTLPTRGTSLSVLVRYAERPEDPVLASSLSGLGDSPATSQPSRIVETFVLILAPRPDADSIPLARLRFTRGHWRIDQRFNAHRVGL